MQKKYTVVVGIVVEASSADAAKNVVSRSLLNESVPNGRINYYYIDSVDEI